jgi:hypothetical protein
MLLQRATEPVNTDFFAHFSATPGTLQEITSNQVCFRRLPKNVREKMSEKTLFWLARHSLQWGAEDQISIYVVNFSKSLTF